MPRYKTGDQSPAISFDIWDRHECYYFHLISGKRYRLRFEDANDAGEVYIKLRRRNHCEQSADLDAILEPFEFYAGRYFRK